MLLAQCVSVRSGCVDIECVVFCFRCGGLQVSGEGSARILITGKDVTKWSGETHS